MPRTRSRPVGRSSRSLATSWTAAAPRLARTAEGSGTMTAWERYLSGEAEAAAGLPRAVVASWERSLRSGVRPTGRSAPLVAEGGAVEDLRQRCRGLLSAAAGLFADAGEVLGQSRSILLLTNEQGVVIEAAGDARTLDRAQDIHLVKGGDWREGVIGTNGIGTALALGRPAQIHGAEHFCEGIKRWSCAAAPIREPGAGRIVGVVDISGPPTAYQKNNLAAAAMAARYVERVLAERAEHERSRLLEVCLERLSARDLGGLVAIDRHGRLVHADSGIDLPVRVGERLPGLEDPLDIEQWARRLPQGLRPEWLNPVTLGGRTIGAMVLVPAGSRAGRPARLADAERQAIEQAVRQVDGNLAEAARALGISRSTLYRKLEYYRLKH